MRRFFGTGIALVLGLTFLVTAFDIVRSTNQPFGISSSNAEPLPVDNAVRTSFLIPAAHPKVKNPSPFMSNGKQFKFDHVSIKDAYERFPDSTTCLALDEANNTPLNLLDLRWDEFKNDDEVRLCFFYIADILDNSERVEDWFRAQGMAIYAFTISETHEPPLTSRTIRGSFSEYVRQSCSIYSMFVAPIFIGAPWRPSWNVRRNAIGLQIAYMLDGKIAGVRVERGSCLN